MVTSIGLGYEAQLVDQVLQWRVAGNTTWNTVDTPVTAAKYRLDGGGTYVRLQYIGDWSYAGGTGPTGGVFTAPATAISPTFMATRGGSNTDWTSQLTAADITAETTAAKNPALTFLDHVDFSRLEARNMVTHRLAVPPISPMIGQGYYDTGLSKRGTWNGYQWDYAISDDRPIGTLNYGVSLRGYEPIVTVTATKTLAATDSGTVQNCTNAAAAIITIPLNTNVAYPIGARIIVRKTTSQTVTIAWASGVTVLNSSGATLTVTGVTSSTVLRKTDVDSWIAFPDLPESAVGGALRVAVDAPTGRSVLGLGPIATQDPAAVAITGGSLQGVYTGNTGALNDSVALAQGVWLGVSATPRSVYSIGELSTAWSIDNQAGNFRWFTPGVLRMSLRAVNPLLQVYSPMISQVCSTTSRPLATSVPPGSQIVVIDSTATPGVYLAISDGANWFKIPVTTLIGV